MKFFGLKLSEIKTYFKNRYRRTIYVLGDSHAEVFYSLNNRIEPYSSQFNVCSVGGATAQGLRNPNSQTDALKIFKEKILSISNKKQKVIFLLGEVDTGFVIWYRSQKYKESLEVQLQNSISTFVEFLVWVKSEGLEDLYVLSVPLPTIKDGQDFGDVANARREVIASQLERTKLTLRYNQLLEESVNKIGCKFISTDHYLLNNETEVIREEFLNEDKKNHHLGDIEYGKVILKELLKYEIFST